MADVPVFIRLASAEHPTTLALADHAASIVAPACAAGPEGLPAGMGSVCASRGSQVAWCAQQFYLANCEGSAPPMKASQPWLCEGMRQLAEGGGAGL